MSNAINRDVLKRAILELLRSDWEFRRAVAAELGLLEILERLERLEERMAEHSRATLALQEQVAKLQEQVRMLQEQVFKLQEQVVKLQEQMAEHSKAIIRLESRIVELQRLVNIVAHRFGLVTEAGLKETMKTVIEEILGVGSVSKLTLRDEEGIVYGYPCEVDMDVVVRDTRHVIVEVKSRVDPGDVRIAALKAKLYEKFYRVKPRVLIVGGFISPKAYEAAAKLGVEIKPAVETEA
ncbi:protein of unknown function DUF1626 [Pyrolobus fumarii 1A]|uniref:DUF3782 domain-containing protein n=1 Tax=Pyrolobus fumarii (strain DSM 11204 / 1A) TaxID=694429 RepID=G0EFV7_PYRF1|nr:DUF3782 domain-containing protein [Pyrolobus fumarii]AEM39058.1 protein of unknown function DUF1626 [Pyrolobus fumarii 1A]